MNPGIEQAAGPRWSPVALLENFWLSAKAAGRELGYSLGLAAATAMLTVPLAWWLAWGARRSGIGQALVATTGCVLLALPGPVLGIGLSLALNRPTRWWGSDGMSVGGHVANWLAALGDSPAVLVWLLSLRTLPFALAVLWPAMRLVNRSLLEAAQIDGAGAWSRFWHVELPASRPAVAAAGLVCAVLSVGELGGSVIVAPPGVQPLSVRIFTLAHFGVENYLAGICLVLLVIATAGALAALASLRWAVNRMKE